MFHLSSGQSIELSSIRLYPFHPQRFDATVRELFDYIQGRYHTKPISVELQKYVSRFYLKACALKMTYDICKENGWTTLRTSQVNRLVQCRIPVFLMTLIHEALRPMEIWSRICLIDYRSISVPHHPFNPYSPHSLEAEKFNDPLYLKNGFPYFPKSFEELENLINPVRTFNVKFVVFDYAADWVVSPFMAEFRRMKLEMTDEKETHNLRLNIPSRRMEELEYSEESDPQKRSDSEEVTKKSKNPIPSVEWTADDTQPVTFNYAHMATYKSDAQRRLQLAHATSGCVVYLCLIRNVDIPYGSSPDISALNFQYARFPDLNSWLALDPMSLTPVDLKPDAIIKYHGCLLQSEKFSTLHPREIARCIAGELRFDGSLSPTNQKIHTN